MPEYTNNSNHNTSKDNNNNPSGSVPAAGRKYQGDITSREAGNIVKNMIREQEKAMMLAYKNSEKD